MELLKPSEFPFIGPSYESRSITFDNSRTVNMFVELHDLGAGKGAQPALLLGTPGLRRVQQLGTGPIRCTYTVSNNSVTYVVSGNEVYQMSSAEGGVVQLSGNLTTSVGPVSMSDNGTHALFVDGANGYTINFASPAVVQINDPNFYNGSTSVTYQGGYFILEKAGTSNFYISDPDSIDFPPLNESSSLSSPDVLVSVISNNEQLYLLGSRTIEVWALTGASASAPFQLIGGRVIFVGCTAQATVRKLAGTFLWLGSNDQGDGVVYSMENDSPTRVSTHAIEYRLQKLGDLSGATAYGYQADGHYFYVLNIPGLGTTFTYDMTSKQWHERQSMQNGEMTRHLGETHAFLNGEHVIGAYNNGNVYVYDTDYFYDNGEPLRRMRQTPHSSKGLANVFYKTMQVDIQPGVGTLTINPRLVLQISRDGGHTFGNPIYTTLGLVGRYRTRARWARLGYGRDLVFRVFCDDPVNVVFLSAYLEVEMGTA
jgi:hypothetical protein